MEPDTPRTRIYPRMGLEQLQSIWEQSKTTAICCEQLPKTIAREAALSQLRSYALMQALIVGYLVV